MQRDQYVFVKYINNGFAHYIVDKRVWEISKKASFDSNVPITHIISGVVYTAKNGAIREVQWEDIPQGYRADAWHYNDTIRQLFVTPYLLNETNQMLNISTTQATLWQKKYKELDAQFNGLRHENALLQKQLSEANTKILSYQTKTEVDKYIDTLNDDSPFKQARNGKSLVVEECSLSLKGLGLSRDYNYSTNPITNSQNTKEMNLQNVIPNFKFGKLDKSISAFIALSMAGIAFRKPGNNQQEETWVVLNRENKQLIEVGDLKFDVDFYQVPVQNLNEGDITIIDGKFCIVEKQNADGSLALINPVTGSRSNKLSRTNIFNMYFYTKVVSMFDFMSGIFNQSGAEGQNNNLFSTVNPMMFMMMGDKGDTSSMMEMMMMSQLMNNQNVFNFGAQNLPPKKKVNTKPNAALKKAATNYKKATAR